MNIFKRAWDIFVVALIVMGELWKLQVVRFFYVLAAAGIIVWLVYAAPNVIAGIIIMVCVAAGLYVVWDICGKLGPDE